MARMKVTSKAARNAAKKATKKANEEAFKSAAAEMGQSLKLPTKNIAKEIEEAAIKEKQDLYNNLFSPKNALGKKEGQLFLGEDSKIRKTYDSLNTKERSINKKLEMARDKVIKDAEIQKTAKKDIEESKLNAAKEKLLKKHNQRSADLRDQFSDDPSLRSKIDSTFKTQTSNKSAADSAKVFEEGFKKQEEEMLKGRTPITSEMEKTFKKDRFSDKNAYMKHKTNNEYLEALEDFKKGNFNNPLLEQVAADYDSTSSLTEEIINNARYKAVNNASAKDMTLIDNMGYYQVPQKAAGVMGTAWLVNKLASSNGQQSNGQLYGQEGY